MKHKHQIIGAGGQIPIKKGGIYIWKSFLKIYCAICSKVFKQKGVKISII